MNEEIIEVSFAKAKNEEQVRVTEAMNWWVEKCDCCQVVKKKSDIWTEEHVCCGSGFTFTFCNHCEKHSSPECDKIICDTISTHLERNRKYWREQGVSF
jgi:hypothetical protein